MSHVISFYYHYYTWKYQKQNKRHVPYNRLFFDVRWILCRVHAKLMFLFVLWGSLLLSECLNKNKDTNVLYILEINNG